MKQQPSKIIRPSLTKNDGHTLITKKDGKVTISHYNGNPIQTTATNSKVNEKAKSVIKITKRSSTPEKSDEPPQKVIKPASNKSEEDENDNDKSGKEEMNGAAVNKG